MELCGNLEAESWRSFTARWHIWEANETDFWESLPAAVTQVSSDAAWKQLLAGDTVDFNGWRLVPLETCTWTEPAKPEAGVAARKTVYLVLAWKFTGGWRQQGGRVPG